MSVAEAQEKIDSREYARWRAYERIRGPIGPSRDYLCAALICSVIANANRGKNARAFTAHDFMPDFDKPEKKHSPAEFHAAMKAAAARFKT